MFGYLIAGIALTGSLLASYFDLKTTNVPDIISIYTAVIGIAINLVASIVTQNMFFIQASLVVGAAFTAIGYLKYLTKMWGGADFLLLGALGFTLPYLPTEFSPVFTSPLWSFPFTIFFNLLLVGSVYSIFYALFVAFKKKETLNLIKHNLFKYKKEFQYTTIAYAGIVIVSIFSFKQYFLTIFFLSLKLYAYFLILWLLYVFLRTMQKDIMERKIQTSRLKEGDVLAKNVILKSKTISADRIEGLTRKDLKAIRKEKKWVTTMEGVPYIPSFFLTIIVSLTLGDILTAIFLAI